MSYARFNAESDVYVYSDGEEINCCGCKLDPVKQFSSAVFVEIFRHLTVHVERGHKVPSYCFARLIDEWQRGMWREEEGDDSSAASAVS